MKKEMAQWFTGIGLSALLGLGVGLNIGAREGVYVPTDTFTAAERYGKSPAYLAGFEAGEQYTAEVGMRNSGPHGNMGQAPRCYEDEVIIQGKSGRFDTCYPLDDLLEENVDRAIQLWQWAH